MLAPLQRETDDSWNGIPGAKPMGPLPPCADDSACQPGCKEHDGGRFRNGADVEDAVVGPCNAETVANNRSRRRPVRRETFPARGRTSRRKRPRTITEKEEKGALNCPEWKS